MFTNESYFKYGGFGLWTGVGGGGGGGVQPPA